MNKIVIHFPFFFILMFFTSTIFAQKAIFVDFNNSDLEVVEAKKVLGSSNVTHLAFSNMDENAILKTLEEKNLNPEILILSGHQGGGHFYGENGGISLANLENFKNEIEKEGHQKEKAFFERMKNVKALYLLGCHAGTLFLTYRWKALFPSTEIIVSYEGQAPLGNKIQGHAYLNYFLSNQQKILESKNDDIQVNKLLSYKPTVKNIFDYSNAPAVTLFSDNNSQLSKYMHFIFSKDNNLETRKAEIFSFDPANCSDLIEKKLPIYLKRLDLKNLRAIKEKTPSLEAKEFWGAFHEDYVKDQICLKFLKDNDRVQDQMTKMAEVQNIEFDKNMLFDENEFDEKLFFYKYYHNIQKNFLKSATTIGKVELAQVNKTLSNLNIVSLKNLIAQTIINLKTKNEQIYSLLENVDVDKMDNEQNESLSKKLRLIVNADVESSLKNITHDEEKFKENCNKTLDIIETRSFKKNPILTEKILKCLKYEQLAQARLRYVSVPYYDFRIKNYIAFFQTLIDGDMSILKSYLNRLENLKINSQLLSNTLAKEEQLFDFAKPRDCSFQTLDDLMKKEGCPLYLIHQFFGNTFLGSASTMLGLRKWVLVEVFPGIVPFPWHEANPTPGNYLDPMLYVKLYSPALKEKAISNILHELNFYTYIY